MLDLFVFVYGLICDLICVSAIFIFDVFALQHFERFSSFFCALLSHTLNLVLDQRHFKVFGSRLSIVDKRHSILIYFLLLSVSTMCQTSQQELKDWHIAYNKQFFMLCPCKL